MIHLAAESHVDNSIWGPEQFIQTNIKGTFCLINSAYRNWMDSPFNYKEKYKQARFLHISTDEVYGSLGKAGFFDEQSRYTPNSPYSASKASSDLIVRSYQHTYGLNCLITNCSNNYGPHQHDEKLIPIIIRNALQQKPIPIYGDGTNVRDWLYVQDHCRALDLVYHKGRSGQTYNIGSRNEMRNIDFAEMICTILDENKLSHSGSYKELITFVQDRPGHDQRYAVDPTKIETELGFKPGWNFDEGLRHTIDYYRQRYKPIINPQEQLLW